MTSALVANPTVLTRLPTLRLEASRIILGQFVQYVDNAGGWRRHEGKTPLPRSRRYLGMLTRRGNQQFVDGRPEVVAEMLDGPPLPDVDDLNAAIPQDQWSIGLSGKPEPPWKREFIVYFLDLIELAVMTYSNNTIGAIRAVTDLEDRWEIARSLFGSDVLPLFELAEVPFPTTHGERKRPIFDIKGWRVFREGVLRVVDTSALEATLVTPQPKSLSEDLRDSIPH